MSEAKLGFGITKMALPTTSQNIQNRELNLHHLFVCRHDDFGFRFHRAQGFRVGEALRFFAVDADDFLDVAGKFFDVALQFIFVRVAGISVE